MRPERPKNRSRRPEPVGKLIPKVFDEIGLGENSAALTLLRVWDEAIGEQFAPHCRPDGLRRGVIYARVRDSAWMQRLQLEKPQLMARLEEAAGEPIATDLRFRVGPI